MPTVHRQVLDAARVARDHATALLYAARLEGAPRADLDTLADYADEVRDRWLWAVEADTAAILAALDCDGSPA